MTAPTYAYLSQAHLISAMGASDGTIGASFPLLAALFLQNTSTDSGDGYFNAADSESLKVSKIKEIFKIDGFFIVASTNKIGFIGYCNKNGSWAQYHKESRFSNLLPPYGGANMPFVLFNDAGLNRKGECYLSNVASAVENNGFKLTGYFEEAFYNPAISYGIKWRKYGDSEYNTKTLSLSIPASRKLQISNHPIDVDESDYYYIEAPYEYEVMAFLVNSEGDAQHYYGKLRAYPIIKTLKKGANLYQTFYSNSINIYSSRRSIVVGANLFLDSLGTSRPDIGIYMETTPTTPGQQVRYFITQLVSKPSGEEGDQLCQVTSVAWYTIPYPRVSQWFSGYAQIQDDYDIMISMARSVAQANFWGNNYVIWLDTGDMKYYQQEDGGGQGGSVYAQEGCYIRMNGSIEEIYVIVNGVNIY